MNFPISLRWIFTAKIFFTAMNSLLVSQCITDSVFYFIWILIAKDYPYPKPDIQATIYYCQFHYIILIFGKYLQKSLILKICLVVFVCFIDPFWWISTLCLLCSIVVLAFLKISYSSSKPRQCWQQRVNRLHGVYIPFILPMYKQF